MPQLRPSSRPRPSPRPRRRRRSPAARCFPARSRPTSASTRCRSPRARTAIVASIGLDDPLHADFGSGRYEGGPIGIPYDVVSQAHRSARKVRFDYADESDRVRYPIPRGVHIEGGRDGRRPPRAAARPRPLPAVRAVRAAQGRPGAWTRGLGRDVEPAHDEAAAGGLDARRRRRAADPAAARPLRRGPARAGSTTRCA